jgi:DNA-binding NtrC family response regulator
VTLTLPPLRERPGDVELLAEYFLARFSSHMGADNPGITREALALLQAHPWPGNVRELANTLQKALIYNRGTPVSAEGIAQAISGKASPAPGGSGPASESAIRQWVREGLMSHPRENFFDTYMDRFASLLISEALTLTGGNRSQCAKLLGLSRPTLHAKIEKYGLKMETTVKTFAKGEDLR